MQKIEIDLACICLAVNQMFSIKYKFQGILPFQLEKQTPWIITNPYLPQNVTHIEPSCEALVQNKNKAACNILNETDC